MHTLSQRGELIIDGDDCGGARCFLEGQPLHCGTVVQYAVGEEWLFARFEMDRRGGYLILDDDRTIGVSAADAPRCRRLDR